MKEELNNYLRDYHSICVENIYNDLHGFIRLQNTYLPIYAALSEGKKWMDEADKMGTLEMLEDLKERYDKSENEQELNEIRNRIRQRKRITKRAIEAYGRALLSTSLEAEKFFEIYHKIGMIYHRTGEYDCAIQEYNRAISIKDDDPIFYYHRGEAYEKKGDNYQTAEDVKHAVENFKRATEDYKTVVQLLPTLPTLSINLEIDYHKLCSAFLKCKKWNELKEVLKTLKGILPDWQFEDLLQKIEKDASMLNMEREFEYIRTDAEEMQRRY